VRTQDRRTNTGFTLTELLVALGIVVLLAALSIPAIEPMIKVKNVDSAANLVQGAILTVRNMAVAEGTQAYCWTVAGSVYDMGLVTNSAAVGGAVTDINIIVDNQTSGKYTKTGTPWSNFAEGYLNNTDALNTSTGSATWTFTLPPGTGTLTVNAYWTAYTNRATNVYYKVLTAEGREETFGPFSQKLGAAGGEWHQICQRPFIGGGDRYVKVDVVAANAWVMADAVQILGQVDPRCPPETLVDSTKTWPTDCWKNNYVTWVSSRTGTAYSKQVASSTLDGKINAVSAWSPAPEVGAQYLLSRNDPTAAAQLDLVIGGGTRQNRIWSGVTPGLAIYPWQVDDGGSDTARVAFPIVFSPVGRLVTTQPIDHINLKIYDREIPTDQMRWRYVRIYRNTGRIFVGRTLSEMD